MAENPLVRVPKLWPMVNRSNQLRRNVVGKARSFDIIEWDNTPYGPDTRQQLTFYELNDLCPRDGWPTVLLIHGGGWAEGDRSHFNAIAPLFARRGIQAVSMNYRLSPENRWPAQVDDVVLALEFLREQQIDRNRIALWGHSAGGHMALMAAIRKPDWIKCVVTVGAPTALDRCVVDTIPSTFAESDLHNASPAYRTEPLPPVLCVHGKLDRVVGIHHADRLAKQHPNVETLLVENGDHGVRWPIIAGWRAKKTARDWLTQQLDLPQRGSKWKRRKKKNR